MLVVLGSLIADGVFRFLPYLLCFVVAVMGQVVSNLANDYYDFLNGMDNHRMAGFERILASGKMAPSETKKLLLIALGICILAGGILVLMEGWELLLIGVVVIFGAISYSAGPFPLSHHGLGDLAVVLYYGLIPTLGTYYVVAGVPPLYLLFLALGIGLWETNILVCNNYRDYEEDSESGKTTIVVRMGEASGPVLYQINSFAALISLFLGMMLQGSWIFAILVSILSGIFFLAGNAAIKKFEGPKLNKLLVYTARISLLTAVMLLIALVV